MTTVQVFPRRAEMDWLQRRGNGPRPHAAMAPVDRELAVGRADSTRIGLNG